MLEGPSNFRGKSGSVTLGVNQDLSHARTYTHAHSSGVNQDLSYARTYGGMRTHTSSEEIFFLSVKCVHYSMECESG